jgi:hypothetical protein
MNVEETLIRSVKRIGSQPRFDLPGERCISLGDLFISQFSALRLHT